TAGPAHGPRSTCSRAKPSIAPARERNSAEHASTTSRSSPFAVLGGARESAEQRDELASLYFCLAPPLRQQSRWENNPGDTMPCRATGDGVRGGGGRPARSSARPKAPLAIAIFFRSGNYVVFPVASYPNTAQSCGNEDGGPGLISFQNVTLPSA